MTKSGAGNNEEITNTVKVIKFLDATMEIMKTTEEIEKEEAALLASRELRTKKKHEESNKGSHAEVPSTKRKDVGEVNVPVKKVKKNIDDNMAKLETLNCRSTQKTIVNLLKELDTVQRSAIEECGFGSLLAWTVEEIPMKISHWLLMRFNPVSGKLNMGESNPEVRITAKDVEYYFGLPRGEKKIDIKHALKEEELLNSFRDQFGKVKDKETGELKSKHLKEIKQKDLAKIIQECKVPNNWFKRNLVLLFISTVVESNSNSLVNLKFLDFLKDTSKFREYDWCDFVLKILTESAIEWKRKESGYFRGPILLLLLVYVDRMTIKNEETLRELPVIKNWNSESLRERQQKETRLGGFGLGFVRSEIEKEVNDKRIDDTTQPRPQENQARETNEVRENEDALLGFLESYINEGRELAMSIRKFIKTIRKAPVELTDNGLFRRVNEAIEKMLNVKISPLGSTQRPQTQEDEESASQAQF